MCSGTFWRRHSSPKTSTAACTPCGGPSSLLPMAAQIARSISGSKLAKASLSSAQSSIAVYSHATDAPAPPHAAPSSRPDGACIDVPAAKIKEENEKTPWRPCALEPLLQVLEPARRDSRKEAGSKGGSTKRRRGTSEEKGRGATL